MSDLAIAYAMKRKAKKMAQGGTVTDDKTVGEIIGYPGSTKTPVKKAEGGEMDPDQYAIGGSVVDRIMARRGNETNPVMMSEGGKVANGSMTEGLADQKPNEFDDLVLRDDLESENTGETAGDFIGDEQEDADRADIVSRAMRSRAKKDRLPSPR